MANDIDPQQLRNATPCGQAALLRSFISRPGADPMLLTASLMSLIKSDSLDPAVMSVWLSALRDPRPAVAALRCPHSELMRWAGMRHIVKRLRKPSTYREAWQAVGGVEGLVEVMATLSVRGIKKLCKGLAKTATAVQLVDERQSNMTALLGALCPDLGIARDDAIPNPDRRPLQAHYCRIVPACTREAVLIWAKKSEEQPGMFSCNADDIRRPRWDRHRAVLEQQLLKSVFPASKPDFGDVSRLKPCIEADLSFGVVILSKFADGRSITWSQASGFASNVIKPLVEQSTSKLRNFREVFPLLLRCLQQHNGLRKWLNNTYGDVRLKDLLGAAARPWMVSEATEGDRQIYATLVSLMPGADLDRINFTDTLLRVVPSRRYELLRVFLLNAPKYGYDIQLQHQPEPATLSGRQRTSFALSTSLFKVLTPHQGLMLCERLMAAFPAQNFLQPPSKFSIEHSALDQKLRGENSRDPRVLHAYLLGRASAVAPGLSAEAKDAMEKLREEVSTRRKIASQGRHSYDRSFWLCSTMSLVVALGDLDLLKDTLLWTRRFIKDAWSIRQMYSNKILVITEFIELLCAVPKEPSLDMPSEDVVFQRVQKSNAIILDMYHIAAPMALEPGYGSFYWEQVMKLANRVVAERIRQLDSFQKSFRLSDSAAYECVLQPTLDMMIERESTMLASECHELIKSPHKFLDEIDEDLGDLKRPAMSFFDNLAKARDQLWMKHRSRNDPRTITLDPPWPRGLAIQHLWPDRLEIPSQLPYIQSRAEGVVFCQPDVVLCPLQDDEEIDKVVNGFVDEWQRALKIYVKTGKTDSKSVAERISRAWKYAVNDLSRGRMSLAEAERFWTPHFNSYNLGQVWVASFSEASNSLSFPEAEELADHPIEWCPDKNYQSDTEVRESGRYLSQTYLDCMLEATESGGETFPARQRPKLPPAHFVEPSRRRRINQTELTGSTIDAYVASAMLVLNTTYGSGSSLLLEPFPNSQDRRFPAVFLEEQFLERDNASREALDLLDQFRSHIPPSLLQRLALSMLERLDATDIDKRWSSPLVKVLQMLSRSDTPSLAAPLVRRFVLEHPNSSAWQRKVFNPQIMSRLEPQDAQGFLESFASAVFECLQKQSAERLGKADDLKPDQAQPGHLKVTTMKLIPQVLGLGPFVPLPLALSVLRRIATQAHHVDIVLVALEGLMSLAKRSTDRRTRQAVQETIREIAVPIAGSLNEARPETERDFALAESGGKLPTITGGEIDERPLLDMLMRSALQDGNPEDGSWLKDLWYDAIRLSLEKNRRWMSLFMQKNNFSLPPGEELPLAPVSAKAFTLVFEHADVSQIPPDLFHVMRRFVLANLKPGSGLAKITAAVNANATLLASNGGAHWVSLWGLSRGEAFRLSTKWAAQRFETVALRERDGEILPISSTAIEGYILEIFDILIEQADLDSFNSLWWILWPLQQELGAPPVIGRVSSVLQQVIDRVDSIRTPQWQADPNRHPPRLPDVLKVRLNLLLPRNTNKEGAAPKESIPTFVARIVDLLERITAGGRPYHEDFGTIQASLVMNCPFKLEVVAILGLPECIMQQKEPTLVDYLRVDLAAALISKETEQKVPGDVLEMIVTWERSHIEYFREVARLTRDKHSSKRQ